MLPSELARFEEVCRFGRERHDQLATTIAAAFAHDPAWRWLLGATDALELDRSLPLARLLVTQSSPHDEIHGFRHHQAVALWRSPDRTQPAASPLDAIGDRASAIHELQQAMHAARPTEPHWYLATIATHPDRQGEGLSSQLLEAMHRRVDAQRLGIYAESTTPPSHAFYRRHGYGETGEITALDSPPLLGFWRSPQ